MRRSRRFTSSRALLLGILVFALAWADADLPRPPAAESLVVVTLDTTRADRLSPYGASWVRTPVIDDVAVNGVVFGAASTVAPLTLTAHTSLFTGLYPMHHGVRDNIAAPVAATYATLASRLHAHGFHTAAFVGSTVLAHDRGLARGFDVYDDGGMDEAGVGRRRTATAVVNAAMHWIDGLDEAPFFLWVHVYDAHAPQTPPAEFLRRSSDPYVGAIEYVDSELGRLFTTLDRKNRLAKTAIVIAADHGESLGDHGEVQHGIFLYDSTIHVPLIVRAPGVRAQHIQTPVSLVDVMPTALALLGVESGPVDGVNLLPMLRGAAPSRRLIYAESMYPLRFGWAALRSVRDDRFKYVDAPRPEFYDLWADPFELDNLIARQSASASKFSRGLGAFDAPGATGLAQPALTPARLRALETLGYVARAPGGGAAQTSPALDPKDYIQLYNAMRDRVAR